jgi:16S rRNA (uracil1498-N3)-methyltransferase
MRRFFLSPEAIQSGRPTLTGPDVKHIKTVLRLKPGDTVVLFDGEGRDYLACIETVTQKAVTLTVLERFPSISDCSAEITIGQALLKGRKMDRLVRQMTELGMVALIPVIARRSVPKPKKDRWLTKKNRWESIARESLKQCGRSQSLCLEPPASLEEVLDRSDMYDLRIIFHHDRTLTNAEVKLSRREPLSRVLALVGPEGGFAPDEVQLAMRCGFVCVSLGPRILKADTAVVAVCAILQHALGDMVTTHLKNASKAP